MRTERAWVGLGLWLLLGCGGSGKPAAAPDNLTIRDIENQTEAACQELQGCDLIGEGAPALDDCVSRGLYTIESGTKSCAKAYWQFESCVADLGCGDLEALFKAPDESAECFQLANQVQQECNVNVL
jgi:hypothetical protein